jgi:hypothetical protein
MAASYKAGGAELNSRGNCVGHCVASEPEYRLSALGRILT